MFMGYIGDTLKNKLGDSGYNQASSGYNQLIRKTELDRRRLAERE